jgi:phage terminase large subunit-like protein
VPAPPRAISSATPSGGLALHAGTRSSSSRTTLDDEGKVLQEGKKYRPADRACYFIELLPHIKGDWAGARERIRLEPWQVFIVASIFGWVIARRERRRFRVADLFVPRKNAKSTKAAGIGLYMLAADGEFGAEVYSGATSENQAGEVFNPAKLMAERTPEFRAALRRHGARANLDRSRRTASSSR